MIDELNESVERTIDELILSIDELLTNYWRTIAELLGITWCKTEHKWITIVLTNLHPSTTKLSQQPLVL